MRWPWRPRNTFKSGLQQIIYGLENGSIVLSSQSDPIPDSSGRCSEETWDSIVSQYKVGFLTTGRVVECAGRSVSVELKGSIRATGYHKQGIPYPPRMDEEVLCLVHSVNHREKSIEVLLLGPVVHPWVGEEAVQLEVKLPLTARA